MPDPPQCTICTRPVESPPRPPSETGHAVRLCRRCEGVVRDLASGGPVGPPDSDVVAYEPVGREYAPEGGELVFLGTEPRFYRVEVGDDETGSGAMIYLDPVPGDEDPVAITELADEIGAAMDAGEFYRATVDADAVLDHEVWWQAIAAQAPASFRERERTAADADETDADESDDADADETDASAGTDGDISIPDAIDREWESIEETDDAREAERDDPDRSEPLDLE